MEVSSEEYVVFGVVLFLWELVPTTFVVLFFRAQRLSQNLVGRGELLRLNTSLSGEQTSRKAVRNLTPGLFSCHRLQQEWSIVTVTAPEPTSSTIQGATTAMTTCRGLGPEKEGKCCAGRVEKAPSCFYWVKVIRSGYHADCLQVEMCSGYIQEASSRNADLSSAGGLGLLNYLRRSFSAGK